MKNEFGNLKIKAMQKTLTIYHLVINN